MSTLARPSNLRRNTNPIALHAIDLQQSQHGPFLIGFNRLGDHHQVEAMGNLANRIHQKLVIAIPGDAADEAAVDFQVIQFERGQIAEL